MQKGTSENSQSPAVACPRCGYDQRGLMAMWANACPLQGRCSECGLEYSWGEVLLPRKFEPVWCVEYVARGAGIPMACMKTFLRSFWPWGFWSRLRMSHRIRPWRLAAYIASLFVFLVCFYVV